MNALVLLTPSFISSLAILVMFVIAEKVPCFVDDFAAAITTAFYTILCLVSIFICVTANKVWTHMTPFNSIGEEAVQRHYCINFASWGN